MRCARSLLSCSTVVAAFAVIGATPAYAASDDPIEDCRASSTSDADRIACLEDAVRALTGRAPVVADAAAEPGPIADKAMAAPMPEAAPAPVLAAPSGPSLMPDPFMAPDVAPEPSAAPTGIGAEQVARREEERRRRDGEPPLEQKQEVTVDVADFAYTSLDDLIIFLDNGQVWRQRRGDKTKIKLRASKRYTATITEGALSGYRLRINEVKRTMIVERIK